MNVFNYYHIHGYFNHSAGSCRTPRRNALSRYTADYHPVNVHKASASRIAAGMKGVGLKTATAIVAYRKANGPFNSLDALAAVKGVGPRTLQKNESVIVLE